MIEENEKADDTTGSKSVGKQGDLTTEEYLGKIPALMVYVLKDGYKKYNGCKDRWVVLAEIQSAENQRDLNT